MYVKDCCQVDNEFLWMSNSVKKQHQIISWGESI